MKNFIECFNCGSVFKHDENTVVFKLSNIPNLSQKIVPFFIKISYNWRKFTGLIRFLSSNRVNKAHFTEDGLDKIRQIKASMNTGRSKDV